MHSNVAIIIPSRLGSTRLDKKPLKQIGSQSMISHVLDQVKLTKLQNIYVATDSDLIAEKVAEKNCKSIMTDPNCSSGTDRVFDAFQLIPNKAEIEYIINVQGDMPFVEPEAILAVIENLKNSSFQIMTPVAKVNKEVADFNSNVKVVVNNTGKALYFSRNLIPFGANEFLYHIGIYGFRKKTLAEFVQLPQSPLEKYENLEQLRAMENNIDIGVCYVDNIPISVDTQEDLNKAIAFYNSLPV
jgi:3-deoxy-manno-octulosonate cytidylyltransferase (CMP-KDO synthetase)